MKFSCFFLYRKMWVLFEDNLENKYRLIILSFNVSLEQQFLERKWRIWNIEAQLFN